VSSKDREFDAEAERLAQQQQFSMDTDCVFRNNRQTHTNRLTGDANYTLTQNALAMSTPPKYAMTPVVKPLNTIQKPGTVSAQDSS